MTTEKRILIVEDDPGIRELLAELAKREGIAYDIAEDGQQAINHLEKNDYSILLLDLMLPKMSGYNILQFLRNKPQGSKASVIVVTANADDFMRRVDPNVVDAIIRKPFDVEEMRRLILSKLGGDAGADATVRMKVQNPGEGDKTRSS
ncbi:MAG TPA: response regulator [Thermoanaerobaculia bacterium]|nr:response regulator [Thermoanaerobaculia bacterium]